MAERHFLIQTALIATAAHDVTRPLMSRAIGAEVLRRQLMFWRW